MVVLFSLYKSWVEYEVFNNLRGLFSQSKDCGLDSTRALNLLRQVSEQFWAAFNQSIQQQILASLTKNNWCHEACLALTEVHLALLP